MNLGGGGSPRTRSKERAGAAERRHQPSPSPAEYSTPIDRNPRLENRETWRTLGFFLEQIPQILVVNVVMVLNLAWLDEGAQQARTAIGGRLLQVGIARLHVLAQHRGGPLRPAEILDRRVDIVRQVAFGLAQVLHLRDLAVEPRLE